LFVFVIFLGGKLTSQSKGQIYHSLLLQ